MPKCDGACSEHKGEVVRVRVGDGYRDWGEFHYCESAIAEDRSQGFSVEIIKET